MSFPKQMCQRASCEGRRVSSSPTKTVWPLTVVIHMPFGVGRTAVTGWQSRSWQHCFGYQDTFVPSESKCMWLREGREKAANATNAIKVRAGNFHMVHPRGKLMESPTHNADPRCDKKDINESPKLPVRHSFKNTEPYVRTQDRRYRERTISVIDPLCFAQKCEDA